MRKLIAITQVTLDGVMQAPGGPEEDPTNGFTDGGWAMHFGDDVLRGIIRETIAGKFDMLLGRRTYEIFAAYWPNQGDNPIAKAFNKATKYVATHTLDHLDWASSRLISGDVVEEVRRLKASDGPEFHIWGSGKLLQALIAASLVDEHRLWIVPIVLGKGKRLFENDVPARTLTLVETRSTSTGVLVNTYHPAGPLPKPQAQPDTPSEAELARRRKLAAEGSRI
jgi:dihydrofolate reductase